MPTTEDLALTDAEIQTAVNAEYGLHIVPLIAVNRGGHRAVAAAQLKKCKAIVPLRDVIREALLPIVIDELVQAKALNDGLIGVVQLLMDAIDVPLNNAMSRIPGLNAVACERNLEILVRSRDRGYEQDSKTTLEEWLIAEAARVGRITIDARLTKEGLKDLDEGNYATLDELERGLDIPKRQPPRVYEEVSCDSGGYLPMHECGPQCKRYQQGYRG